ncbi:MAG TPA: hypothetical protein VHY09_06100, partial [Candidatus Methylacidiphilales bacterium]|nr:hypothetical protein [Candidatus Methylacidiphilales bacterium]
YAHDAQHALTPVLAVRPLVAKLAAANAGVGESDNKDEGRGEKDSGENKVRRNLRWRFHCLASLRIKTDKPKQF